MWTDFSYIQNQYDAITENIFSSDLMILATVNISSEKIPSNTMSTRFGDSLDARVNPIKRDYPDGILRFYRIELYPTEHGLKVTETTGLITTPLGQVEGYDIWMSCKEDRALVRGNSTMFDFAENVQFQGMRYNVRGVVKELFGDCRILHVFLTKETNE